MSTFNYTRHKALWQYLVDHPEQDKERALRALKIQMDVRPINDCYACEACKVEDEMLWIGYRPNCINCPLDWSSYSSNGLYMCEDEFAPYRQWHELPERCFIEPSKKFTFSEDYEREVDKLYKPILEKRTRLAIEMRDMPINTNFKGEVI